MGRRLFCLLTQPKLIKVIAVVVLLPPMFFSAVAAGVLLVGVQLHTHPNTRKDKHDGVPLTGVSSPLCGGCCVCGVVCVGCCCCCLCWVVLLLCLLEVGWMGAFVPPKSTSTSNIQRSSSTIHTNNIHYPHTPKLRVFAGLPWGLLCSVHTTRLNTPWGPNPCLGVPIHA